ncbi:ribosome biogenesis protein tsr1 [Malassezia pachydermatis]|uniref:Ribosome biogenesis protein tsr1 n=1 Tax=Malassezia pachydermatis TaxID=77020 RepID=A0A0M9VN66_9BASI|nr:ribosome biogenesis protein tsr1 [Malassezia pachydermatis]KOS12755.1 ribosome biogenesis protein tsr1 [Malassezia pachydermatis]
MPFSHRPTLKQKNKRFKSGHATKGALKRAAKGKHESAEPSAVNRAHKANALRMSGSAEGSRTNRRNEARQISQQKRAALVESTRVFGGTGLRGEQRAGGSGRHAKAGAPRICAVIALTPDVNEWDVVRALECDGDALGVHPVPGKSADEAQAQSHALCELDASRFRQTLQFLPLPYGALLPAMDACRCADFVVLVLSAATSIEPGSWGELCLRSLQAHGMPQTLAVVPTLASANDAPFAKAKKNTQSKDAQGARKSLLSFVQYFVPELTKIHAMDDAASRSVFLRTLVTTAPKRVAWRDFRSWCVVEDASYVPQQDEKGLLKVQGWIRGAPLSANRLVHIPDFGDFAVDHISYAPTGTPLDAVLPEEAMNEASAPATTTLVPGTVLDQRDEDEADELISENEPDLLANEQTWPTEEEMAHATEVEPMEDALPPALPGTTPREILKRQTELEGQKRYQAAWIVESDDEGDDDEGDASDVAMDDDDDEASDPEAMQAEASIDLQPDGNEEDNDDDDIEEEDYNEEEELQAIAAYREQLQKEREAEKEEAQDAEFPDEIDTPMDVPARQRFARYRGLESMYTTYWDPYEDLPQDYARLFQFDDFSKTRKRVESNSLMEGIAPGIRVCVWIRDVPAAAAERALQATGHGQAGKKHEVVPFVFFGLLRHEHKKSVINFTVTRNTEYTAPVRSKDPLVVCLGFRRYMARPVYSQHLRRVGRGGNNVYKYERFLPHGVGAAVGSVYAPVTFGGANVPVVLLRMRSESKEFGYDDQGVSAEQTPHLVGAGSVLDVAPTRIIAKRIVLSGHPYKLHKKTATIRFMFFNADDVRYFAPITLRTKYGRTGHIKESLGTHGYFKAHFDGPMSQMDTVLLNLYKVTNSWVFRT